MMLLFATPVVLVFIFNRVLVDLDILQHFTTPTSSIDGFA